ncbi:MAG: diguanylate cyclase [Oscillospiraceae bacterium]|nr:diguanylate cyclase [Oscillospiraceae bacterium]
MSNQNADLLFGFLRDIIYNPSSASLDVNLLEADFRALGEGLVYFAQCIQEQRRFALALSRGELHMPVPPPENMLASPLKALHGSLLHLTWQSQQVAKGDYQQHVDFMGEFSEAFNTMVRQLDARARSIEREMDLNKSKTQALEQSNALLTSLTSNAPQMIIVVSNEDGGILFENDSAKDLLHSTPTLISRLLAPEENVKDGTPGYDLELTLGDTPRYFSVASYALHWSGQNATAFLLNDVSSDIQLFKKLESHAYYDNLTLLHNRYYGMHLFHQWLDEGQEFILCFADLDNLKYVNDNFGHAEGDVYIKKAANLLQYFFKEAVCCRLGGDEFMLLIPRCTAAEASRLMEALRAHLEASNQAKPYYSNISYGIVEVRADNTLLSGELLSMADESMYLYKRAHKKNSQKRPPSA